MEWIKRFLDHDAGPWAQFIKYGMAGGLATVTHIGVFFLLGWKWLPCLTPDDIMVRLLGIMPAPAPEAQRALNAALGAGIAFVAANAVAYALNVCFVFKRGRHHWLLEILYFYAVSAISMAIGTTLQSVLIVKGVMTTLAFGTNILSALLINYAMRKFFIFRA